MDIELFFPGSVCEEFKEEEKSSSWIDSKTYFPKSNMVICSEIGSITLEEIEGSSPFKNSDSITIF